MTRLVSEHDRPHIRSPRETASPISRFAQEDKSVAEETALFGHVRVPFVHLDTARLIQSWKNLKDAVQRLCIRYVSSELPSR